MSELLGEMIEAAARRAPDRLAIITDTHSLTYAELDAEADALASALAAGGLRPGQCVGVLARNHHWYPIIFLAVARAGGILVPLNVRAAPAEIADIAARVSMAVLFADSEFDEAIAAVAAVAAVPAAPLIVGTDGGATQAAALTAAHRGQRLRVAVDPASAGIVMFTSGTTGKPKGVTTSHRNFRGLMELQARACDVRADDVLQLVMPLFHNGGFVAVMGAALAAGAATAFYSGSFDAEKVLAHAKKYHVTIAHWIATMLSRLVSHLDGRPADLPRLRCIHYGAMPTTPDLLAKVDACFAVPRLQIYGTTDCGLIAVRRPDEAVSAADVTGRLVADEIIDIVNEDGLPVAVGAVGEIVVKAATAGMMGYWDDAAQSARVMRGDWIHSGDLARRERDGFIALVARKDNLIISGGENIYPDEIEEIIASHPMVREVVICGVPDSDLGEAVFAVVAAAQDAVDIAALRAHCAGRLAAFKMPRRLLVVDELPRTDTGKIARRAARDLALAAR